mmetsp:Transcript_25199/g.62421  ORF Transcript_25199/g.62421 Transcript_25199/m.62421 type:complete len:80 (+) Transcript_25199:2100-2339(+)
MCVASRGMCFCVSCVCGVCASRRGTGLEMMRSLIAASQFNAPTHLSAALKVSLTHTHIPLDLPILARTRTHTHAHERST